MSRLLYRARLLALALPMLVSCGSEEANPGSSGSSASDDPGQHFQNLAALVKAGSYADAYVAFMPPKYDKDIEAMFARLKTLVTKEDFDRTRAFLKTLGEKLAPALSQAVADQEPAMKNAVSSLADLPNALGLETYADFKRIDVRTLISRLEKSFLKVMATSEPFAQMATNLSFKVVSTGEHFADVEMTSTSILGGSSTESFRAVRVDGRWVPSDMRDGWEEFRTSAREGIDMLAAAKKENPRVILAAIDEAEQNMEQIVQQTVFGLSQLGEMGMGVGAATTQSAPVLPAGTLELDVEAEQPKAEAIEIRDEPLPEESATPEPPEATTDAKSADEADSDQ